MPVRAFDYGKKFYLSMVFLLSFSMATPVIQGLGYDGPGFFGRFLFTALAAAFYALVHLFPALALSLPLFFISLGLINRFHNPGLLADLYTALSKPQPDSLLWPLLLTASITLAHYLLLHRMKEPLLPLLLVGLVSFVPLWYFFIDSSLPAAAAYASGWLLLAGYANGRRFWSDEASEDSRNLRSRWMNFSAALVFIALLVSLILPKSFAPLPWPSLQEWFRVRAPFLEELRGSEAPEPEEKEREPVYTFSSLSAGRLDGPLRQDETVLLEVKGQAGFYLKGSVFDTYTGTTWINTLTPEVLTRFEEPPAALAGSLTEAGFEVTHRNIETNTVFTLLYPVEINGLIWELKADQNTNITSARSLPPGQEYRVEGFLPGPRLEIRSLETGRSAPYTERFLQLPADLPSRVIDRAREIAEPQAGNFLKLRALESYLRSSYTYNTEPPLLPAGSDFVDFFLFQAEEGYCISFASALAVMARAAGIPARYVTGFQVPGLPSENGVYEITSWNAHAWVESYIPGVGWLPFEATPGFSGAGYLGPPGETAESPVESPPDTINETRPEMDPGLPPLADPDEETPVRGLSLRGLGQGLAALLLAGVFGFFLLVLGRFLLIRRNLLELDVQKPGRRAVAYYNLTLRFMERLGLGKEPGETPREYSQRTVPFFLYPRVLEFKEMSEGLNLTLYSMERVDNPRLAGQSRAFFRDVFNRYLARVGRITAFKDILIHRRYFNAIEPWGRASPRKGHH